MREGRDVVGLSAESLLEYRITTSRAGEHLAGHLAMQGSVVGTPDHAHPTRSNNFDQVVAIVQYRRVLTHLWRHEPTLQTHPVSTSSRRVT
jgi:hypothetical protein